MEHLCIDIELVLIQAVEEVAHEVRLAKQRLNLALLVLHKCRWWGMAKGSLAE